MDHTEETAAKTLKQPRRRWWRMLLMSTLILACGMVIGSGLTLYIAVHRVMDTIQNPQHVPERMTERMGKHLDLTDEQAAAVRAILEEGQEELLAIRDEVEPRVTAQLDKMQADIESVLTPEQVERFRNRIDLLKARLEPARPPE